ncbi:hypothetical protein ACC764_39455, partial [Rhizobium ruizarguesonis]
MKTPVFVSDINNPAGIPPEDDKAIGSAILLRGLKISAPGDYKIEVAAGEETKSVTWNVYEKAAQPKAKNI